MCSFLWMPGLCNSLSVSFVIRPSTHPPTHHPSVSLALPLPFFCWHHCASYNHCSRWGLTESTVPHQLLILLLLLLNLYSSFCVPVTEPFLPPTTKRHRILNFPEQKAQRVGEDYGCVRIVKRNFRRYKIFLLRRDHVPVFLPNPELDFSSVVGNSTFRGALALAWGGIILSLVASQLSSHLQLLGC